MKAESRSPSCNLPSLCCSSDPLRPSVDSPDRGPSVAAASQIITLPASVRVQFETCVPASRGYPHQMAHPLIRAAHGELPPSTSCGRSPQFGVSRSTAMYLGAASDVGNIAGRAAVSKRGATGCLRLFVFRAEHPGGNERRRLQSSITHRETDPNDSVTSLDTATRSPRFPRLLAPGSWTAASGGLVGVRRVRSPTGREECGQQ